MKKPLWKRIIRQLQHEIKWLEHHWRPVELPCYLPNTPVVSQSCFESNADLGEWYSPVLLSPSTIGQIASSVECIQKTMEILRKLEADSYVRYLLAYYQAGIDRFGERWQYADITTTLLAVSQILKPHNYLEIGVRRGRSMAMVAAICPRCEIVGFDMWVEGYGNAANPGPDFVKKELHEVGFQGTVEFMNGDSHKTVAEYFRMHPESYFDLITVDGDHSLRGASLDLKDVLPRLKVGGVIVFDDITQPRLEFLAKVWQRYVKGQPRFATWEYCDLGYGVAVGIRKY